MFPEFSDQRLEPAFVGGEPERADGDPGGPRAQTQDQNPQGDNQSQTSEKEEQQLVDGEEKKIRMTMMMMIEKAAIIFFVERKRGRKVEKMKWIDHR